MNEKEYVENIPMWAKKKTSLKHIKERIELFNLKLPKIIHVAGTNGKGSVCAYLSNILMANKKRVATFISPHLKEVNERILLNMQPISDNDFEHTSCYIRETLKGRAPTYFEYLFYIAIVYFSRNNPDYIILETGLGGRLDVTNVFDNTLSIITSIGMDHMKYLGDNIKDIAYEKVGIIKENSIVIFDDSNKEAMRMILETAKRKNSKAIALSSFNYQDLDFTEVEYKKKAAALAILAAKGLGEEVENINQVLKNTVWHGRMEEIKKNIFFDGAHNEPAILEFVKNALQITKSGSIKLLLSIVKDKEYDKIFYILTKNLEVEKYYLTTLKSYRSSNIDDLKSSLIKNLDKNSKKSEIVCFNSAKDAFIMAENEKKEDEVLFCVGSLYLIGELLYDRL